MKSKLIYLILITGLILGFIVRIKDLQAPLADWHSFRQADTASVAREYVKHGIDLLTPTYHDLSNIQSGKDNPNGYRMVEFPLLNATVAWIYLHISPLQALELHVVYRLFDIVLSLISAIFLFLIVQKIGSTTQALLSFLVFLFLPFNIYYSRTILPEIGLTTFTLMAVFLTIQYIDHPNLWRFFLALITLSLGLLIKPVAIFFYLPIVGYVLTKRGFIRSLSNWQLWLLAILSTLPLFLWRRWILQFPEGIPDAIWLLNGNHIRFKGAWFYWLFADRLGSLILGYWGVPLLAFGLLAKKKNVIIAWWILGSLLYLIIFATGNVQHDYYQIPLIPLISVLVAYGIHFLATTKIFPIHKSYFFILVSVLFTFSFSWYHVRDYYHINNPAIVAAGKAVDKLIPPDALVIAPYMGDTAFLYQTNRRGWPIGFDIEDKIRKGAQYYVSVNFDDEAKELMNRYSVIEKTDQFIIIDLTQPTNHLATSK